MRNPIARLSVAGLVALTAGLWVALASPAYAQEKQDKQDKVVPKVTLPETTIRLLGARCRGDCWLSGLFAPAVVREKVAVLPVANNTPNEKVTITAKFVPTNALATTQKGWLSLQASAGPDLLLEKGQFALESGETEQLKLQLKSDELPAGLYAAQVQFTIKPQDPNASAIVRTVGVELRVRDSALLALLTVVIGILVGRLGQLVNDPKLMARAQLLDWLQELAQRALTLPDADKAALEARIADLRAQLFSRGADPNALRSQFEDVEKELAASIRKRADTRALEDGQTRSVGHKRAERGWFVSVLVWPFLAIGSFLRVLAGVTPLPLPTVYGWLLPVFVLFTLVGLTTVFMLQQYGGTGAAETFGAGGLADYAGLFLAGLASEVIAGGLRAVRLR